MLDNLFQKEMNNLKSIYFIWYHTFINTHLTKKDLERTLNKKWRVSVQLTKVNAFKQSYGISASCKPNLLVFITNIQSTIFLQHTHYQRIVRYLPQTVRSKGLSNAIALRCRPFLSPDRRPPAVMPSKTFSGSKGLAVVQAQCTEPQGKRIWMKWESRGNAPNVWSRVCFRIREPQWQRTLRCKWSCSFLVFEYICRPEHICAMRTLSINRTS